MSILITGGCGFIGSYLARDLIRAGHEVVVTDVRDPTLLREIVVGDLGEEAMPPVHMVDLADVSGLVRVCRTQAVESIVHMAGLLTAGAAAAPAHAAAVNVVGTGNLFEVAASFGMRQVVWTSSISVFGYIASDALVSDDSPHAPDTFYGVYKSANEHQARLYNEHFGIPSIGIRVGFAYGYGRTRGRGAWVHELLGKPALGLPGRVRGGNVLVPWLYVEDASAALAKAVMVEPDGARFYNTQGTPRWKSEAVDYVNRLVPGADVQIVGEEEGYPTGLDDHRIREELGWEPVHSLEEGISEAVNRYRRAAGLPILEPPSISAS